MKIRNLIIAVTFLASSLTQAGEIRFTSGELAAVITLLKPESTTLILDGKKGSMEPPPFVRYFGIGTQEFPIDMSLIADIIDLRFNRAIGRNPHMFLRNGGLEIDMGFEDRVGVVRSRVGRIDCRKVVITAVLDWRERAGGARELYVRTMRFSGSLGGNGILGTRVILNRTKKLAMKLFGEQIQKILDKPDFQAGIQAGLSQWAQFMLGNRDVDADISSVAFVKEGDVTSLKFRTIP